MFLKITDTQRSWHTALVRTKRFSLVFGKKLKTTYLNGYMDKLGRGTRAAYY